MRRKKNLGCVVLQGSVRTDWFISNFKVLTDLDRVNCFKILNQVEITSNGHMMISKVGNVRKKFRNEFIIVPVWCIYIEAWTTEVFCSLPNTMT